MPPPGWSAAPDPEQDGLEVWPEEGAGTLHLISFDAGDDFGTSVAALGDVELIRSPINLSGFPHPDRFHHAAPDPGEQTDELLGELGYDATAIAQLRTPVTRHDGSQAPAIDFLRDFSTALSALPKFEPDELDVAIAELDVPFVPFTAAPAPPEHRFSDEFAASQGFTADGDLQMPSFAQSGLKIKLPAQEAVVDGDHKAEMTIMLANVHGGLNESDFVF